MTALPPLPPSVARTSELPPLVQTYEPAVWDDDAEHWTMHCPVLHKPTGTYCQLPRAHSQPSDTATTHKAVIRVQGQRPVDISWVA